MLKWTVRQWRIRNSKDEVLGPPTKGNTFHSAAFRPAPFSLLRLGRRCHVLQSKLKSSCSEAHANYLAEDGEFIRGSFCRADGRFCSAPLFRPCGWADSLGCLVCDWRQAVHLACGSVPNMLMSRNKQGLNLPNLKSEALFVSGFLREPPTLSEE